MMAHIIDGWLSKPSMMEAYTTLGNTLPSSQSVGMHHQWLNGFASDTHSIAQ